MKILIITSFWPSVANTVAGIFVLQQVEAFARQGASVEVLVLQPFNRTRGPLLTAGLSSATPVSRKHFVSVPRIRLAPAATHFANSLSAGRQIATWLAHRQRSWRPDIIHVHGLRPCGLALAVGTRAAQTPTILTIHGEDRDLVADVQASPLVARLVTSVSRCTSRITLVGTPLIPYATGLGFKDEDMVVIPNGHEPPSGTDQRPGPFPRRKRIVSVSNLVDCKGIDDNLRALRELAIGGYESIEYHIIGDGVERNRLVALCAELGLTDRVVFRGRLGYSETMEAIEQADVFALPSWGEAFGIVYLEAMSRGKPVIGCATAGARDAVRDGIDGFLVPPKRPDAVADALLKLLTNPVLVHQMGESAVKHAKSFTWDRNVNNYLNLFRSVLNEDSADVGSPG